MNWLQSMLSDGTNNSISSKRVITVLAFLLCGGGYVASMCGVHVDNKLYDSLMYIVVAGLGFTASEKFASK
jgi:hypothetical protein